MPHFVYSFYCSCLIWVVCDEIWITHLNVNMKFSILHLNSFNCRNIFFSISYLILIVNFFGFDYVMCFKCGSFINSACVSDSRVFMTIAVDMVIEGIQEPVRFIVETRAKIFPSNERFWYFSTKPHVEHFILKLKEVVILYTF